MNHYLKVYCFASLSFLLLACSDSGPNLAEQVQEQIEEGWSLSNFRIIAEEDLGSEISPVKGFRFSAKVKPKDDLYMRVASLRGNTILKKLYDSKEVHSLHGTGTSTLRAETWHTTLSYEESPWGRERAYGRLYAEGVTTRDAFGDNALVIGTDAYASFRDELLAEVEQSKQRIADFEKETRAIIDAANIKRHELNARVRDSSEAMRQLQRDNSDADNVLFRQLNRTSKREEKQKVYEELMALRASNSEALKKAREEHNELIAERNRLMQGLDTEVSTAELEYRRSRMGLQNVLEMESLLKSFEQ